MSNSIKILFYQKVAILLQCCQRVLKESRERVLNRNYLPAKQIFSKIWFAKSFVLSKLTYKLYFMSENLQK